MFVATLALLAAGQTPPTASPASPASAPATGAAAGQDAWPFDANQAELRQVQAAESLGVPRELKLDLGGDISMRLVLIPAGKFVMGSPAEEKGRLDDEGPPHEVTITRPFYMGIFDVTQAQYEQVTGKNPSRYKGTADPVENVSWDDAVEFCKLLSRKTGRALRLPTEAQWEWACRAGTTTPFSSGATFDSNLAKTYGTYVVVGGGRTRTVQKTTPVGLGKANAFGLYDMHGNAWQWCDDWYGKDYYSSSPKSDPRGPASGQYRVLRGGSWLAVPRNCRSACRFGSAPAHGQPFFGFRAVCLLAGDEAQPTADPATRPAQVFQAWPFDANQAAQRQEETARALAIARQLSLDLGEKKSMKLVLIPAGVFTMGSPREEPSRGDEEALHEVTISRPFYMGAGHVTRGQFAAFIAASGHKTDAQKAGWAVAWGGEECEKVEGASWRQPGFEQEDDQPAVCVSYNDAVAFCLWLGKKAGRNVALPTEAQWEFACRAGSPAAYQWGAEPADGNGLCNAAQEGTDEVFFTTPAGKFKPNALGLYDMHGNAWQWCADWYDKDYYAHSPKTDPQGPAAGTLRVLRGGSWLSLRHECRSANRYGAAADQSYCSFGFRVVCSAPGT